MLDALLDRFRTVHPGVDVISVAIPGDQIVAEFKDRAPAGLGPDLLLVDAEALHDLAQVGLVADLAGREDVDPSQYLSRALTSVGDGRRLFGLPFSMHTQVLFYNKELVSTPPTNFDELLDRTAQCERLALNTQLAEILWGVGAFRGRLIDAQGRLATGSGGLTNWLDELRRSQTTPGIIAGEDAGALRQAFVDGEASYYVADSQELPRLQEAMGAEKVGVALLPGEADGTWDAGQLPAYQQCADDFMALYPNITIRIEQTDWPGYWTKLYEEMDADTAPDVFTNHLSRLPELAQQGQVMDLEPLVQRDKVDTSLYIGRLARLWTRAGQRYGLPKDWDSIALMVNLDRLGEAGVTLEEFNQAMWNPEDGGTFQRILARLINQQGYVTPFDQMASVGGESLFLEGKAAIIPAGSWMISTYAEAPFDVGFARLPIGPQGRRSILNGLADSIWSGTAHPEEAWVFTQYLGSVACQLRVGEAGVVFPAMLSGTERVLAAYADQRPDVSPYTAQAVDPKDTIFFPVTDHASEVVRIVAPAIQSILAGEARAEELLPQVNERVNALFD